MGGGNGQKSAAARERNLATKLKAQKMKDRESSKGKIQADKEKLKCKICLACFLEGANIKLLQSHFESKHEPKGFTFAQCFPDKV